MEATITIPDAQNALSAVFEAELKTTVNDRAAYTLSHCDGQTSFHVIAKDIVALRATLNAIAKQLVVYHKMASLGEKDE